MRFDSECECVYVMVVKQTVEADINAVEQLEFKFVKDMADSLGDEVSYKQIVVLEKIPGSTVITYEVQPPPNAVWFTSQATVDNIVDILQNDEYTLSEEFGTSKVQEITLPIGIPGFDSTVASSGDDPDTTLLIVILVFVVALVVAIIGGFLAVRYYRARLLKEEERGLMSSSATPPRQAKVHPQPSDSGSGSEDEEEGFVDKYLQQELSADGGFGNNKPRGDGFSASTFPDHEEGRRFEIPPPAAPFPGPPPSSSRGAGGHGLTTGDGGGGLPPPRSRGLGIESRI